MNDTPQAAFRFENYKITSFTFSDIISDDDSDTIGINFHPSGIFNKSDSLNNDNPSYLLEFDFVATVLDDEKIEQSLITATMGAYFTFRQKIDEVPDYFYNNSIAIVFPYMRAFVTTLTTLANTKQILLPILNLSHLRDVLMQNTKTIGGIADELNSGE